MAWSLPRYLVLEPPLDKPYPSKQWSAFAREQDKETAPSYRVQTGHFCGGSQPKTITALCICAGVRRLDHCELLAITESILPLEGVLMIFKVPFNPNHSVILWLGRDFPNFALGRTNCRGNLIHSALHFFVIRFGAYQLLSCLNP